MGVDVGGTFTDLSSACPRSDGSELIQSAVRDRRTRAEREWRSSPLSSTSPQATLDDLAARLARTRWPDEVEGAGWDYGTNLAYLQAVVEYWRTRFDWRGQERAMNAFPHFRASVNGLGVHFIHARGQGHRPLPLLVTHGWPSSFVEMLDLIPLLADPAAHGGDPADAFDVVVPSVPGFGFSDRPVRRGMTRSRVARSGYS